MWKNRETWKDRLQKAEVRKQVTAFPSSGKKYEAILVMPGKSCLCLKGLLASGAIDRTTLVLAVEYDRTVVASIREFLAANFNNTDVFEYKLPHWYAIPWFKEKLKERKLDFVYLDTCCALTASMTAWLAEFRNSSVVVEGTKMFTTFCNYRNASWADTAWKMIVKGCDINWDIDDSLCLWSATRVISQSADEYVPTPVWNKAWLVKHLLEIAFGCGHKRYWLYHDSSTYMFVTEFILKKSKNKKIQLLKRAIDIHNHNMGTASSSYVRLTSIFWHPGKKAWETIRRQQATSKAA